MKKNHLSFLFVILVFPIVYLLFDRISGREFQWGVIIASIGGAGLAYIVQWYKIKKYGTPEVDERVLALANKYIKKVFIFATVIFSFSLMAFKAKGISAIPIDYLFVYLLLLLFSMTAAVMIAKRR